MADTPTNPPQPPAPPAAPTPTPTPAPTPPAVVPPAPQAPPAAPVQPLAWTHLLIPKGVAYAIAAVVLVAVLAGGFFAARHFLGGGKPLPVPGPVDFVPQAVVTGTYWPGSPVPIRATPDAPAQPVGMLRLDATGSKSQAPMFWQVRGPSGGAGRPRIFSPDGSIGGGMAEVDLFRPGTYYAHGTAIGLVGGKIVVDTASVSVSPEAPAPPKPDVPTPVVPPTPKPDVPVVPVVPPAPVVPTDPMAALGQTYRGAIGSGLADAFEAGAKMLDAGQPFSVAYKQVGTEWQAARTKAFETHLTPAFARILPESTPDDKVTPDQRSAMSAAWKSLGAGLRSR